MQPPLLLLAHTWLERRAGGRIRPLAATAPGGGGAGVTSPAAPRFDESLAVAARGLHLGGLAVAAFVAALALFLWLERRGRPRWAQVPSATFSTQSAPYRASSMVSEHLERAPSLRARRGLRRASRSACSSRRSSSWRW